MPQIFHNYASLINLEEEMIKNSTLFFDVEEALLKSYSIFSIFMLVAFEGGGLLRALILLLLYPFITCLVWENMRLKAMIFICFFGVKKRTFRLGRSVLPKVLLEKVGQEGLEMVMKFSNKKVGVSRLPRVMVEGFLKDYLGIEDIIGGEIKEYGGYYLGLLDKMGDDKENLLKGLFSNLDTNYVVGIGGGKTCFQKFPFLCCKDIFVLSKGDKKWTSLPRDKYPKPLVFHDGRLAFEPTLQATLTMFLWLPFGIILCISRTFIALLLPFKLSSPILAFIGVSYKSSSYPKNAQKTDKIGVVYVCNHKTVLDSIYLSLILQTHVTALAYSISKITYALSPVRTLNLTRDREKDAQIMRSALQNGSLVVCPEGTTCREPYLLRFSPLFAEISDNIIPLAIEGKFTMFHGTTASGMKALDGFFVLLNPKPYYYVKFLNKLPKKWTCKGGNKSKFEVANYVQGEIGKALGYECTQLTRRNKYAILAGNDGFVMTSK